MWAPESNRPTEANAGVPRLPGCATCLEICLDSAGDGPADPAAVHGGVPGRCLAPTSLSLSSARACNQEIIYAELGELTGATDSATATGRHGNVSGRPQSDPRPTLQDRTQRITPP